MPGPGTDAGSTQEVEFTDWESALSADSGSDDLDTAGAEADASEAGNDPSLEAETTKVVEAEAEAEGQESGDESPDALEPPERWTDEAKTHFLSLDKPSQELLLAREADVERHLTKRTQELSETQTRYERLDPVLKPYEDIARQQGLELAPLVGQAMQYFSAYMRDPASTVKQLIQQNQWSAQDLGLADSDDEQYTDPDVKALRSELTKTQQELASLRQGSAQNEAQSIQSQIAAFRDAKNDDGSPKYPHFEAARSRMAPLIGEGKTLEDAYAEAVWTVPEYRESQSAAQIKAAEKAAREKAEAARDKKVREARQAETLGPSDADKSDTGKSTFNGWEGALRETHSQMTQ